MNNIGLPINKRQKLKMKKNADEFVDIKIEKQLDPKYKTEFCKSWIQTNLCVYGNKCRFAHGSSEIFSKSQSTSNYKQKDCKSFEENGFCMYGSRCNFRHSEIKLKEIDRSYYNIMLSLYKDKLVNQVDFKSSLGGNYWNNISHSSSYNYSYGYLNTGYSNRQVCRKETVKDERRLSVFKQITTKSSSFSENSTENNSENEVEGVSDEVSNTSINCDEKLKVGTSHQFHQFNKDSSNKSPGEQSDFIKNSLLF